MIVPAKASFLRYIPKSILQQPFELLLSFMCCTSGSTYVLGNIPAVAIDNNLPTYFVRTWGGCLCLGGGIVIFGILKNSPLAERAGLSLLAPTSLVYAILLVVYVGIKSIFSVSIIIGFSLACAIKDYMIKIATLSIKQVFRDHPNE